MTQLQVPSRLICDDPAQPTQAFEDPSIGQSLSAACQDPQQSQAVAREIMLHRFVGKGEKPDLASRCVLCFLPVSGVLGQQAQPSAQTII